MRKPIQFILALFTLGFLFGVAFAQEAVTSGFDLASLFIDAASLAVAVVAIVAFLREHLIKSVQGIGVVLLSLGVGAGLGLAGSALGYVDGGALAGVGLGLSAGLLASGGWDAITGALAKRDPKSGAARLEG
ncbi:MAG: hypothetical protein KF875_03715 [Trueperaceae bacterium]|nr:hypothetical protein [Trueperaceae bacterium]